jgi:NAD(P)-dependent dehydrogenase (short-subunit alcohol dehydrogenase family)
MARPHARVAVVTGAAHGIGLAVSRQLIAAGWRVGAVDLPGSGLGRAYAKQAKAVAIIEGDIAEEPTSKNAVTHTIEQFGRLDAVVSNAGMSRNKPIARLSLDEWRRVFDVNLTAAFLLARVAEKPLRRAKGAMVLIASTRALMSEAHTEAYSASKGGLVALAHALSISLAPDVRVNCVSPGWIMTGDYSTLKRRDHAQHPAGRVGKPQDIADIVSFLIDHDRAGFITGANVVVDGGMTRKMIYVE